MTRKQKEKQKEKVRRILVFVAVVIVSLLVIFITLKLLKISMGLITLRDNISFYNGATGRSEEWTRETKEYLRIRNEMFYQSDDTFVRVFSNLPAFWKIVSMIATCYASGYVIIFWCKFSAICVKTKIKRIRRKRVNNLRY